MKNLISILSILLLSAVADAQNIPYFYPCESVPYSFDDGTEYTNPPSSYKAFYISHYGRHGSRTDLKASRLYYVENVLREASGKGILTPKGDSLLVDVLKEKEYAQGRFEYLTPLGAQQHSEIACRMAKRFPSVFKGKGKTVFARSTKYQRCLQSMNAFTVSLVRECPHLNIVAETSDAITDTLDFQRTPQMRVDIKRIEKKFADKARPDSLPMLQSIFVDVDSARLIFGSADEFFTKLYFLAGMGLNIPNPVDLYRYFAPEVLEYQWDFRNRNSYVNNCYSAEWGEERMRQATVCIKDIIERSDKAISGSSVAADLRFGHDYPLLSILSFFRVEIIPEGLSFAQIRDAGYIESDIVPMAANLQLIFYRSKCRSRIVVKILLNEKEVLLRGIKPVEGPYFDWSELKATLLDRIAE